MKPILILLAIALALVLALGMAAKTVAHLAPSSAETFSLAEEFAVRELYPGGRLVDGGRAYEICSKEGIKVRLYPDGLKLYFPQRSCWR